ncbi:hypothetical protein [Niabella hibiscisoli]|uniref:hypothetical protein n=1 Tax=Niabella hibiscisoli TaxID=1825928 RepID=UPI001F10A1AE|nr:hypothetical protein [Niabella hibiscisoli]MCH5721150.1 hypothetical protein [Niabella hibiscisoli]
MLIVRGVGLSLLFIPITTMALSTLKGQQIGQGAAFYRHDAAARRIIWCSRNYNFYEQ